MIRSNIEMLRAGIDELVDSQMPLAEFVESARLLFVSAAINHEQGNYCRAARLIRTHRNTVMRIAGPKKGFGVESR